MNIFYIFATMNILLDTNIIIPLEDTNKELLSTHAVLKRLGTEQGYRFLIHPNQLDDIKRDKNKERRKIVLSRMNQYHCIEDPPILSKSERLNLGWQCKNDNDQVDNNILYSLYRGAVHLLVTEDEGIHKKAKDSGFHDKVYRLNQFISLLQSFEDKKYKSNFTGVNEGFLYEVEKNQPFFNSLRNTYNGFDDWYQKSAESHRKCWYIKDDTGFLSALCIYKLEKDYIQTDEPNKIKGNILKLCTLKVDSKLRGKKLGERLLYIAFDYCHSNNIDWIYLHTYGDEQRSLIGLCKEYGFYFLGKYKDDDVYIKSMGIDNNETNPLNFVIKYYPYFLSSEAIRKFIIPIKPHFHEDLFPDHSNLINSLFSKDQSLCSCQGNTIKKAYLCHSNIRQIAQGDIILFYRSKDRRSIQCLGIVEKTIFSNEINEVLPIIAKRTVFKLEELKQILAKKTLIILFRYISLPKEISNIDIQDANIIGSTQTIREITHEQYINLISR